MIINPFILANKQGIPRIESNSVTVGTDNVTYNFSLQNIFRGSFAGLIIFKLEAIPAGTTGTLPLRFSSPRGSVAVTTIGGAAVTAAQITGAGIYLAFYDTNVGQLQLLTGI